MYLCLFFDSFCFPGVPPQMRPLQAEKHVDGAETPQSSQLWLFYTI